ncbi:uncharacterized protein [Diadema antillarum]|uniref:uncharacterized protein n=1 Tax=Diadema antillarum TaxID=105358 RepID=UPI003A874F2E
MSFSESGSERSRVFLWCVPRAGSTAFTKCLSAIEDMEVYFEPFAYSFVAARTYKQLCGEDLPMSYAGNEEEFRKTADLVSYGVRTKVEPQRLAYSSVKKALENANSKRVFVKDMGAGVVSSNAFQFMPSGFKHTFLIRNPIRSINSTRKAMFTNQSQLGLLKGKSANERTYDVEHDDPTYPSGYYIQELYDLWKYVRENIDSDPIVIDADDLLTKPAEYLKAYCDKVGLPFSESLLKWDASTDSLKSWKAAGDNLVLDAVNFYGRAMRSSEFLPPSKFPEKLTSDVIRCSNKVMKYFEEMYAHRLKLYNCH